MTWCRLLFVAIEAGSLPRWSAVDGLFMEDVFDVV